jgi:NAD(P)-dependent dehydrogenase (short-subunit alcohol dehydrogenase family)
MALVTDLFNVEGLVAVVTGAGRGRHSPEHVITDLFNYFAGIGLMMANALEANGAATVYIVGRRMEALEATVKHSVC